MSKDRRKPYRLGRRPGEQGPRPLQCNQGRVEKLATGKPGQVSKKSTSTDKLKLVKNTLTVGTWDVQTLWSTGKLELPRNEMKRFRYDIIGISEVLWTGKGETSNKDFIWSGEDKTHNRGVGLLLNTNARQALIGYNPLSSRIITPRFNAAPFKITVVHAYAPTAASSDEEIEAFYNDPEETLSKIHKKDIIIMIGDWNAKVGSDNTDWKQAMGRYGYGDRNEKRRAPPRLRNNTSAAYMQQKPQRKWTWASPDGVHENMIDLILVQQRWKSSVINCRTFKSVDICSNHALVLCNIRLRLKRMYNKAQQSARIDVSQLKNEVIRKCHSDKVAKNIENTKPADNLDEYAKNIESAIKKGSRCSNTH